MENRFIILYKELVKQVRKTNGLNTFICCTLWLMDRYLYHHIHDAVNELKEETGDKRICCFAYIPIDMMIEGYGVAGHPSVKTDVRIGRELAAYLRKYVLEAE